MYVRPFNTDIVPREFVTESHKHKVEGGAKGRWSAPYADICTPFEELHLDIWTFPDARSSEGPITTQSHDAPGEFQSTDMGERFRVSEGQ